MIKLLISSIKKQKPSYSLKMRFLIENKWVYPNNQPSSGVYKLDSKKIENDLNRLINSFNWSIKCFQFSFKYGAEIVPYEELDGRILSNEEYVSYMQKKEIPVTSIHDIFEHIIPLYCWLKLDYKFFDLLDEIFLQEGAAQEKNLDYMIFEVASSMLYYNSKSYLLGVLGQRSHFTKQFLGIEDYDKILEKRNYSNFEKCFNYFNQQLLANK